MSYLPPSEIKMGYWVDESRSPVLGATITTTTTGANIVIAVLAVIVSVASIYLWNLLLFAFYQARANKDVGDGLYRQQQVLLRNLSGPEKTCLDLSRLAWVWHGKAPNSIRRSVVLVLVALLFSAASIAVSVSSSFIISTSNIKVLVDGSNCGYPVHRNLSISKYINDVTKLALDYAESCYIQEAQTGPCIKYAQPKLDFTTTTAPCPFSPSMCIDKTSAISMDTGYLDSTNDLGFNTKAGDRIQIRKKTTCSPIKVPGYYITTDVDRSQDVYENPLPGEQVFRLQYGVISGFKGTSMGRSTYSTYESNRTDEYILRSQQSGPSYAVAEPGPLYVQMIPELARNDADTILNFIFMNNVESTSPIDDPVFAAHKSLVDEIKVGGYLQNLTVYRADNPFGVIGCAEQYQFCLPTADGRNCTQLGALPVIDEVFPKPNEKQRALLSLFYSMMGGIDMSLAASGLNPLRASDTVGAGLQNERLPRNHWKAEVKLWESFVLAYFQGILAQQAIGAPPSISGPSQPVEKTLCKLQTMRVEGGFANISVFGLAFTIALAGVIILTDLFLIKIFVFLSKYRKALGPKVNRWVQDGVLQLQRKAYEGMGEGEWTKRDKEVPLERKGTMLSDFLADYPLPPSRQTSMGTVVASETGASADTDESRRKAEAQARSGSADQAEFLDSTQAESLVTTQAESQNTPEADSVDSAQAESLSTGQTESRENIGEV